MTVAAAVSLGAETINLAMGLVQAGLTIKDLHRQAAGVQERGVAVAADMRREAMMESRMISARTTQASAQVGSYLAASGASDTMIAQARASVGMQGGVEQRVLEQNLKVSLADLQWQVDDAMSRIQAGVGQSLVGAVGGTVSSAGTIGARAADIKAGR